MERSEGERAAGRSQLLTIGELARRAGVTVKTVRHYSDEGLLPDAGRSGGGHRRYAPEALERLHRIRDLRAFGLSLPAVADALGGGSLEAALAERLRDLGGRLAALRWRQAALRAVTEAPPAERPALLRLLGAVPQPPTSEAPVRFWRRLLPRELPPPLLAAILDEAVPAPPADPDPAQAVGCARLHAFTSRSRMSAAGRCDRPPPATGLAGRADPVALYRGLGEAYPLAAAAAAAGRPPAPGAELDAFVGAHAQAYGERDDDAFRAGLRETVRAGEDPRMAAYWRHVDEVTGGGYPTMGTAHAWLVGALGAAG
ncbi:MerR family transcriptional regulator [Streptomyces sp. NPDC053427]|uniref:MerR family transcriptional regulator n=1 Tax=Streptomyces sp. NPDC053427 TaxID=3365701 RepID=UPI0037CD9FAA